MACGPVAVGWGAAAAGSPGRCSQHPHFSTAFLPSSRLRSGFDSEAVVLSLWHKNPGDDKGLHPDNSPVLPDSEQSILFKPPWVFFIIIMCNWMQVLPDTPPLCQSVTTSLSNQHIVCPTLHKLQEGRCPQSWAFCHSELGATASPGHAAQRLRRTRPAAVTTEFSQGVRGFLMTDRCRHGGSAGCAQPRPRPAVLRVQWIRFQLGPWCSSISLIFPALHHYSLWVYFITHKYPNIYA